MYSTYLHIFLAVMRDTRGQFIESCILHDMGSLEPITDRRCSNLGTWRVITRPVDMLNRAETPASVGFSKSCPQDRDTKSSTHVIMATKCNAKLNHLVHVNE